MKRKRTALTPVFDIILLALTLIRLQVKECRTSVIDFVFAIPVIYISICIFQALTLCSG